MAIKVLKHGHKVLNATCPRCNCEFEFADNDLAIEGNQMESYESIKCPECHYKITWWYGAKSGRSLAAQRPYN